MFPLAKRKISGYKFGEKTFYNTNHTGVDYEAVNVPYKSPFSGIATSGYGIEGGWWWTLVRPNGDKFTARHMKAKCITGKVTEGQVIGITGNSGKFTTNPHLHQEVMVNGKLIDPENYNWNETKTTFMKITVVANKNNWTTLDTQLSQLKEWFKTYSSGRLEPVFNIVHTDFSNIPLADFANVKSVDINWYRDNITPLSSGELTLLLLNPDQWDVVGSFGTMTWGDPKKPVRCEVMAIENEYIVDASVFVHRAFHEICHGLFFLTEQPDRIHEFLYQDPPKRKELLDLIDYPKLQQTLINHWC